jgi:4-hydroxy-tetrahydrodipicolinate synthase
LLIGPEELLFDAVLAGGHGGVNGGANVFPRLYVRLFEAARAGDVTRARQLHGAIMRVSGSLYRIGRHSSAIIKGIKGALSCLGICADGMAEPFSRFREEERKVVQARLAELQVDLGQLDLQP